MEEWRLNFPKIDQPSLVFGGYPRDWFADVLSKPEDKNWSEKASELFFSGGNIGVNRNLPEAYLTDGIRILKCVLGSFEPKHEHKEHVAGLILKSLCS